MTGESVVIFGAGNMGKIALSEMREKKRTVKYYIDNDTAKVGNEIEGIRVISLDEYLYLGERTKIVIANGFDGALQIEKQLKDEGIADYEFFISDRVNRTRLISYCTREEFEDVILYIVLQDEKDLFYIDVGCNDPFCGSVTKLLYDMKNAHGINIDPRLDAFIRTNMERKRDINLNIGIGKQNCERTLFVQEGLSTFVPQNKLSDKFPKDKVKVRTLKSVCQEYVKNGQIISFLKIDTEGYEKEVLLGADFENYRPFIVVIESTLPCTMIPCYEDWEYILLDKGYHFAYEQGVNRYYVANEESRLDEAFKNIKDSINEFDIAYAVLS